MDLVRFLLRPLGYLAFVLAVAMLSGAAKLLGETSDLGIFAARLTRTIWRYPEVTRQGVQMAWLLWAVLLAIALSPVDPLATRWDEVGLAAVALSVVWRRRFGGHQDER